MDDPSRAPREYGYVLRTFGALRHKYFRWLWAGAFVSTAGTWLHWVAAGVIVAELTESAFAVSVVSFLNFVPSLFLGLIGGAIADRFDRRRILIAVQWTELALSGLLALMFVVGFGTVGVIYAITFALGITIAINGPTWFSFYPTLVPREDLHSAVSLNSMQFNVGRVVGPTIGGIVLQFVGPAATFALDALSYLGILVPLHRMRHDHDKPRPSPGALPGSPRGVEAIKAGFAYVGRYPWLRTLLLVKVAQALLVAQVISLLTAFATIDLGLDASRAGALFAAFGVGGTVGALIAPTAVSWVRMRWFVPAMIACIGVTVIVLSAQTSFAASMIVVAFVGIAYIGGGQVGFNTLVQTGIDDAVRGRVTSLLFTTFVGLFPLAALGWGVLASRLNVAATYRIGGVAYLVLATGLVLAPRIFDGYPCTSDSPD